MKKIVYLVALLGVGFLPACKKDRTGNAAVTLNMLKDSIFLYEKEDYLWNDAIPSYNVFNPQQYSSSTDLGTLSNELFAITQLKINPATGRPYEYYPQDPAVPKYSFVDNGTETASLNGTNNDFGFEPLYIALNDLRVKYVYPGSPAALAGLTRGEQITAINGSTDINDDDGNDLNYVIQAFYYSSSITLDLKKPDGTTAHATIKSGSYTVNPVLAYKVFDGGDGKITGYIAFNSFTALSNAQPQLNTAFNYFISKGVTDLVVDLRYNGGGSGQTAAYLDDLIAPAAQTGALMYTTFFNSNLQNNNYTLLAKKFSINPGDFLPKNNQVNFAKALSLNLSRVFFIVTGETASSSELTINNLRPVMNVQLIGDTTYGKPVGEIPIPIGNFVLYSAQEYVENQANQGDYYNGMAPGSTTYPGKLAADDVTKDFGDSTEMLLAHALNYIKTGTYALRTPQVESLSAFSLHQQSVVAGKLDRHKFKGMVLDRLKVRGER